VLAVNVRPQEPTYAGAMAYRAERTDAPGRAWQSYDVVADAYARVSALCHAQLARDLVHAVAPPFGARVLDVGAGSGVAAAAAAEATGPQGRVVATDPASSLLAHARHERVARVAGSAPELPFASDTFDVVIASLVIGHFLDYRPALADLVRVLRPGGRLGITTWGRLDDAPLIDDADERAANAIWDEVAGARVDLDEVDSAAAEALPWDDWFSDPARLRLALTEVGLRVVDLFGRAYRYPLGHADWLQRMNTSVRARYVRALLGTEGFDALNAEVLDALRRHHVGDPIRCADEALITVAVASTPARAR
jgi:ubiquinone/menaquinone biosynthesis C-methylase UbiE